MNYEEFVKDLTYNKNNPLDNILLFNNLDWYYRFLAENAGIYDLYYVWDKLKDHWKEIQNYLPYWNNSQKRICPICGTICIKCFNRHINNCGLTRESYVCMINDLTDVPKCKNPNCNNKVSMHGDRGYYFKEFCSKSCKNQYLIFLGKHNWLSENRPKDDFGNDIIAAKMYKTQIENGTHNLVCKHQLSKTSMWGWHSHPEDLLGDILFNLNIYYLREYWLLNRKYRCDYYLPDYNIILECDGMFKWDKAGNLYQEYLDRKHEIQEKTGIKVINIPSDDIFWYYKNKRSLYNLIVKTEYPIVKFGYFNNLTLS